MERKIIVGPEKQLSGSYRKRLTEQQRVEVFRRHVAITQLPELEQYDAYEALRILIKRWVKNGD